MRATRKECVVSRRHPSVAILAATDPYLLTSLGGRGLLCFPSDTASTEWCSFHFRVSSTSAMSRSAYSPARSAMEAFHGEPFHWGVAITCEMDCDSEGEAFSSYLPNLNFATRKVGSVSLSSENSTHSLVEALLHG